ncbi:MAG: cysteate synthase [Bacteroidales bacterium]|nr:cysteate synthase [Bacteroidales bacterium]
MTSSTHYILKNVASGVKFRDTGWLLDDPNGDQPSLIRAEYEDPQLTLKNPSMGIYQYAAWLPVQRVLQGSCAPVTYRSKELAKYLGLEKLFITFNGYFPEIGARMTTCSFKETEAYSVCGRMNPHEHRVMVVASAGNTARAFAKVCSDNQIPLLLCVPEDNLNALWFDQPLNDCVKLIASEKGSDYFDAIHLSNIAVKSKKFFAEGGAKNIARRDGMGTTVLSATTFIGEIPDYYFQAVGSGTGAIAAFEANLRLIRDGRYGSKVMQLMVSQNRPFIPMYDAWKADSRQLLPMHDDEARHQAAEIDAKVLSNRKPPYGIIGGLYDSLKATNGEVFSIDNETARKAAQLFQSLEQIDIYSAAAVATASLIQAVEEQKIDKNKIVMLNITGGGEQRFFKEHSICYLKPTCIFKIQPDEQEVINAIEQLF